jgi:hypothetical protein
MKQRLGPPVAGNQVPPTFAEPNPSNAYRLPDFTGSANWTGTCRIEEIAAITAVRASRRSSGSRVLRLRNRKLHKSYLTTGNSSLSQELLSTRVLPD